LFLYILWYHIKNKTKIESWVWEWETVYQRQQRRVVVPWRVLPYLDFELKRTWEDMWNVCETEWLWCCVVWIYITTRLLCCLVLLWAGKTQNFETLIFLTTLSWKKKTEAILINGYDTTVDDFGAFKIESDSDEKLRFEGFVWPRWGLMDPFCKRCRFNVRGSLGFSKFKFQN